MIGPTDWHGRLPPLSRYGVLHLAAALFSCLLLPAWSWAKGEGGMAWTMFSRSDSFRLTLRATDPAGAVHLLHPIELARGVDPSLRFYLRSADRFAVWPVGPTFQARLPALARAGCQIGAYTAIELTLERRATLDAPVHTTHVHAACPGR